VVLPAPSSYLNNGRSFFLKFNTHIITLNLSLNFLAGYRRKSEAVDLFTVPTPHIIRFHFNAGCTSPGFFRLPILVYMRLRPGWYLQEFMREITALCYRY